METEFEIKVLDISIDELKKKLEDLGAHFEGKKEYRRYVYDMNPPQEEKWIRLRTDGAKATLTYKHIVDPNAIDGVREWEVSVSSFDTTNELLEQIGYKAKAYQENIRESYTLDGCNIELDSWPMIPPYMEIEGPDKNTVIDMLDKLNFSEAETTSENTTEVYKRYGIDDLNKYSYLSFNRIEEKGQ